MSVSKEVEAVDTSMEAAVESAEGA